VSQSWRDNLCLCCIELCLRRLDNEQHLDLNAFPHYDLLLEEKELYYDTLYSGEELEDILAQEDDPLLQVGERLIQLQQFINRELPEDKAGSAWRTVFGNRKQKEKKKEKKKRQKEKRKGKGMMP
jgi:hypothetical protein